MSVGNATQAFDRLLDAVVAVVERLPQPVLVQYGTNRFSCVTCTGVAFMDMNHFVQKVQTASLLILHAGAGSVLHAIQAGKVPVIVPRRAGFGEHVDDHQIEFARQLGTAGLAVVVEDIADLMQAVEKACAMQVSAPDSRPQPPLVEIVAEILDRCAQDKKSNDWT